MPTRDRLKRLSGGVPVSQWLKELAKEIEKAPTLTGPPETEDYVKAAARVSARHEAISAVAMMPASMFDPQGFPDLVRSQAVEVSGLELRLLEWFRSRPSAVARGLKDAPQMMMELNKGFAAQDDG